MCAKPLFFALLITAALPLRAYAAFDWSLYAQLLQTYVTPGTKDGVAVNLVNYAGLKNDAMFPELLGELRDYDPMQLTTKKQREAFYINAYNILALSEITNHWPVKSIKDIGDPLHDAWHVIVMQNMDGELSLKGIREKELMPIGDLRALFAINCTSVSGPDLRRQPYEAATLNRQLNAQVRRFLSRTDKGLRISHHTAHLSLLFDRYQDDFARLGGVRKFIHHYLPHIKVDNYLPDMHFDWHINSQSASPKNS